MKNKMNITLKKPAKKMVITLKKKAKLPTRPKSIRRTA